MSIMAKTPSGYKKIGSAYLGERPVDKVFNANGDVVYALQRELTGVPPLLFKGKEQSELLNYRIYGDTVDGESVGDRTGNLFDGTFIHRSVIGVEVGADDPNRRSIVVDISNFNNGDKITFSRETSAGNMFQMYQVSSPLEGGGLLNGNVISGNSETLLAKITLDNISEYPYLMIFLNGAINPITDEELLASKIMVNVGNTSIPYEPYGYKVPVTVEGKNLLKNTVTSQTINGVTFTVDADGSVTCNGTASERILFGLNSLAMPLTQTGSFILSGCPNGGSTSSYLLRLSTLDWSIKAEDKGAGVTFIYDAPLRADIRIESGYTCDNLTFYPMIRKADIEDDTYEPYHAPVTTPIYLPEPIKMVGDEAEYIDYAEQKLHRVRKNLLNEEYIQGNPISNSIIRVKCKTPIPLVKGELYTISFDSGSLFDVGLGSSPTPEYPFAADTTILSSCGNSLDWLTSPYTFECVNDGYISVTIRKKDNASITPDEVNFAIQFEKNSTATSYEPYIENTEVDVTLPALPTIKGTNVLSVGTAVQPSRMDIKGRIKSLT